MLQDRTAIVGVGQTELGKGLPESELVLALRAIRAALDDCGIDPSEVDGLASYTMEPDREVEVARNLGLGDITWFSQVGYGGGGGCATVLHAAAAIATGQCSVAVAWRSRKRADKSSRVWAQSPTVLGDYLQWTRPPGLLRPVDEIAMLMRRHMHTYGTTREQLAEVALAFRAHAQRNPGAAMYGRPLTVDAYLDARWISEPLCLFDNCLESDGAAAVVLVSAERARDLPRPPVLVHAGAQGLPRQHNVMAAYFSDDPLLAGPSSAAAPLLWRNADVGPADVKVAQLYDAFSPLVLFSLEGYGFCGRGESGAFVEGGTLGPGGRLPVNTAGGSMSEAYLHGFNLITEGVRQVRGDAVGQVPDADVCMVTSGECVPTSALLLRSDT